MRWRRGIATHLQTQSSRILLPRNVRARHYLCGQSGLTCHTSQLASHISSCWATCKSLHPHLTLNRSSTGHVLNYAGPVHLSPACSAKGPYCIKVHPARTSRCRCWSKTRSRRFELDRNLGWWRFGCSIWLRRRAGPRRYRWSLIHRKPTWTSTHFCSWELQAMRTHQIIWWILKLSCNTYSNYIL